MELDKLRRTGNLTQQQADSIDKEFDDFKKLFAKFLTVDAKDSIVWEKIEKLPQDAVRCRILFFCYSLLIYIFWNVENRPLGFRLYIGLGIRVEILTL